MTGAFAVAYDGLLERKEEHDTKKPEHELQCIHKCLGHMLQLFVGFSYQ